MATKTSKLWHAMSAGEALVALGTSRASGLSGEEARARLDEYGLNVLEEPARRTVLQQFAEQFKEFLVVLLLVSAGVSAFVGELEDALVIAAIVVLNAVIGVVQERRAEDALDALKKMASPHARVVRSGETIIVDAASLVPGDIILIEAGDSIPADARLLESAMLKLDESSLTGESVPVDQDADVVLDGDAALGDRVNMVHMGSSVTYGRGVAAVVATGMSSQMGRIAAMLQESGQETTPLQQKLAAMGKNLGIAALLMCAGVFIAGLARGEQAFDMFLTAVSLAVAAIPEGLPAIVTIVLALGVQRMAARNAIIRHLPAVETLGSADVICSDKTGTLTTNQMTVRKLYVPGLAIDVTGEGYSSPGVPVGTGSGASAAFEASISRMLTCAVLCSDASVRSVGESGRLEMIGDPTEGAIVVAGIGAGVDKARLAEWAPRLAELPFESERKRMTTIHRLPESYLACAKGAPEEILQVCSCVLREGAVIALTDEMREEIRRVNAEMAGRALRVLGVAQREFEAIPEEILVHTVESDMVFLGLVGMQDPPRPEARDAVRECFDAGITPVMITGDHKATAVAIACDVGIMTNDALALTGSELSRIAEDELDEIIDRVRVYARVAPEHKVRIVDAWRRRGHVVAMTGDGVNDAPALRRADIGAAMGITGTDVAKSAADMILTDDNFATIVAAVREGRVVFDNIKKSVQYLVSCNIGEIIVIFAAILLGLPRPLLPIQILWLNLITDGLPALALGVEPAERDLMRRKPRGRLGPVLDRASIVRLLVYGASVAGLGLASFAMGLGWPRELSTSPAELASARTMCLMTMSFSQLLHAFNSRSELGSLFSVGVFANSRLVLAFVVSGLLQLGIVYTPVVSGFFNVVDIHGMRFVESVGLAALILVIGEMVKAVARRRAASAASAK